MRILGLCSYPVEAAATRYRLTQFVKPLAEKGIDLEISPFLSSEQFRLLYQNKSPLRKALGMANPVMRRLSEIFDARRFDLLLVQREAMFFGPAFFEWISQKVGNLPLILDLDDATYVRYVSPVYGKIGSFFKFFGKTDNLINRADLVLCGNRFIADYVRSKKTEAEIVPTIVDTDKFFPVEANNETPVLGWIGTHSTFPFLKSIFPVLEELAKKHRFVLKIVGAGLEKIELKGVNIENLPWQLEREISDFQSIDIGLYPMSTSNSASPEWILGKSGFKAIQYMAVGVPYIVTPVGVCAEIGKPGVTHLTAITEEDWYNSINKLLSHDDLRKQMGAEAREYSLEHYDVETQAERLAGIFKKVYQIYRKNC